MIFNKISLIKGSIAAILMATFMVFPVYAADGDIAGPGLPNKTITLLNGGLTFEYGKPNLGQGTFTMGTADTTLTAQYDAIYYRIVFDGTPNIGNPTRTVSADISDANYYLQSDIDAFNNKMAMAGGSGVLSNGIAYTLRYDKKYKLPSNDTFIKSGYELVGWLTRMPATEEEMEQMANGTNGFNIVNYFDGTNSPRQETFNNNFYKEASPDGGYHFVTRPDSSNKNNNVAASGNSIIADGAEIKNLTWGGYIDNEIVTKQYKTVTLYAIWKLKRVNSNVYYTLQKADGTYSYNVLDTANVKIADSLISRYQEVLGENGLNPNAWILGGQSWNNRLIKSLSRYYRYIGDSAHEQYTIFLKARSTILPYYFLKEDGDIFDTGAGYKLLSDGTKIFIEVPRKTVYFNVYGMISNGLDSVYYTKNLLQTDDKEMIGLFLATANNGSASIILAEQQAETSVEFNGQSISNLIRFRYYGYCGSLLTINNIKARLASTKYNYSYKGYTEGIGDYSLSSTTTGPNKTGNLLTITLDQDKYLLLYFNRSIAIAEPLQVQWGEMTRSYNDPYAIGTGEIAYTGVNSNIGPWSVVTWKNFRVGNGLTTNKVYYMQLYLDNTGYDVRDRLNINALASMPGNPQIELRRYFNNRDIVIIRFNSGITEEQLQNWMRQNFLVITFNKPDKVQSRLHIYLTNIPGYCENNTGVSTGTLPWNQWIGNLGQSEGFIPTSEQTESKAYLIYDDSGLYWKYRYQENGTDTKQGGLISAGDQRAHNYDRDKTKYPKAQTLIGILDNILNKTGLIKAYALLLKCDIKTYDTTDNGIAADILYSGVTKEILGITHVDGTKYWNNIVSDIKPNNTDTINSANVNFILYAGDCLIANIGQATGRDHGGTLYNTSATWGYQVLIDKTLYIIILDGVKTPVYTIAKQYPIVIQYDITKGWGSDPTWDISTKPNTVIKGFDYNWLYGSYATNNLYNPLVIKGIPTNSKINLSKNLLTRFGYVWDGRWYIIYNQQQLPKQFNWLTNTVSSGFNQSYNKNDLLNYNQNFGLILNDSNYLGYIFQNYGYGSVDFPNGSSYKANELLNNIMTQLQKGYIPFTDTEKSNGNPIELNYRDLLQVWMQSGGQVSNVAVNDAYTAGLKLIPCRVITLYSARTVPIQYTLKYVLGGSDKFGLDTFPYSWNTGNYSNVGSINNNASATLEYQLIARSHLLSLNASGTDLTLGQWYRQQFVYDDTKNNNLIILQFLRPNNGITIEGQPLEGYEFIGWTLYKDTTGNNQEASYRKGSTTWQNKGINSTTATADTTSTFGNIYLTASNYLIALLLNSLTYLINENNPVFLKNGIQVKNLLNTVLKVNSGTVMTSNGNVVKPDVVYQDNFKWPEVVLYPNWRKNVTLTVQVDSTCTDIESKGNINGISNQLLSSKYNGDYIYNNQYYYPVSLDRIVYNTNNTNFTSWRYEYNDLGLNTVWKKNVISTVKDKYLRPIYTDYRFLGLLFSNETTYPTSTGNTLSHATDSNKNSLILPNNSVLTNSANEKAYLKGFQLSHPRIYALLVYDTKSKDADKYNTVLNKYFLEPNTLTINKGFVGLDDNVYYKSTVDVYNNTTLYAVWEPVLTSSIEVSKVGALKLTTDGRATAELTKEVNTVDKAGTGYSILTALDGLIPTTKGDTKKAWELESYKTVLEYRYNNNFNNEIINLYKEPIISNPNFILVLDKLNNQATFTANQRDGLTNNNPKLKTPHAYQTWLFYLPLYLGTDEMEKASGGLFKYDPDKIYATTLVALRYSFYYANYISDSEKDSKYLNNETAKVVFNIGLIESTTPPSGGDGGNPNPDPDTGGDAGLILDDLRVHVQLH